MCICVWIGTSNILKASLGNFSLNNYFLWIENVGLLLYDNIGKVPIFHAINDIQAKKETLKGKSINNKKKALQYTQP